MTGNNNPSGSIALTVPNLNIASGANGTTASVTVTPSSGYHGRVYWSLAYTTASSGLSACYVISPLLVAASGTSSTSFTINTGAACTSTSSSQRLGIPRASLAPHPSLPWRRTGATAVMAGLLLCLLPRGRRRHLPRLLCLALLSLPLVTASLSGCGSSQGSTGTPTQSVMPTVVGLALTAHDSVNSSITASSNFTLTVN